MIVVGDPKTLRKASAFVEKFAALVEEFGAAVPMTRDNGVVFEFGLGGAEFAVATVSVGEESRFGLALGTEA